MSSHFQTSRKDNALGSTLCSLRPATVPTAKFFRFTSGARQLTHLKKETSMTLQITTLLAGIFALLMVPLSLQVSTRRVKLGGVSSGSAGDETLRRRIRAHGNFIEYVPTALIAVGLIEFGGGAKPMVTGLAIAFCLSRIIHAIGTLYTSTPTLRAVAMLIQHAAFLVAGVCLVLKAV
jgi:uncharacterized protein